MIIIISQEINQHPFQVEGSLLIKSVIMLTALTG